MTIMRIGERAAIAAQVFGLLNAGAVEQEDLRTLIVRTTHASPEEFDRATRDRFVEPGRDGRGLQLVGWDLVADETGEAYFGNAFRSDVGSETISSNVWVRKQYHLENARAEQAILCLSGGPHGSGDADLIVSVNGHTFPFHADRSEDPGLTYQRDWKRWLCGWLQIPVPVHLLQPGLNDVVIRGDKGCRWSVGLEISSHPNRSAKSYDGGSTWQCDRLGSRGAINGEYVIRLALRRYPAAGVVTGPPIDLTSQAAASGSDVMAVGFPVRLRQLDIREHSRTPRGTAIALQVRVGRTATYTPATWTPWKLVGDFDPAAAEKRLGGKPGFRYLQWQARLTTRHPLRTPVLRAVTCAATLESVTGVQIDCSTLNGKNPLIVRASHPFTYLRPHPRVEVLRKMIFEGLKKHFGLGQKEVEALLATPDGQMTLGRKISAFVTRTLKTKDPFREGDLAASPPQDAVLSLYLGQVDNRQVKLICDGFAIVLSQCCSAMGLPAREYGVGHVMTEVWSNKLRDWYILDSWWPKLYLDAESERPLSAVQMQERLATNTKIIKAWMDLDGEIEKREVTEPWWPFDRFLIALRNDHVERNRPLHYMDTYSSRAHLVVLNDTLQRLPFTDLQSRRLGDFAWTLNQARFHVIAETPRRLLVQIETVTPNLARFEVRRNGAVMSSPTIAKFQEEATGYFDLEIGAEEQTIRCLPINAFGVPGIATTMTVVPAGTENEPIRER